MNAQSQVKELVEKLVAEGSNVLNSKFVSGFNTHVDGEIFHQWRSRCRLLLTLLGPLGSPWKPVLEPDQPNLGTIASKTQGALKGIQQSLAEGLIVRLEDFVLAEAFSDLSAQASYLLQQGYFLAAGVIFRAVLEEKLRQLCNRHACLPPKANPTINDLNQALYAATPPCYDKTVLMHVTSLAAVGNDAAHNNPNLKKEDVERLARDVPPFLARFST